MSTTERTKTVSYGWPCWFLSCSISVLLEFRSSKTLGLPFSKFRESGSFLFLHGALSSASLDAAKPSGGVSSHRLACQAMSHAESR